MAKSWKGPGAIKQKGYSFDVLRRHLNNSRTGVRREGCHPSQSRAAPFVPFDMPSYVQLPTALMVGGASVGSPSMSTINM